MNDSEFDVLLDEVDFNSQQVHPFVFIKLRDSVSSDVVFRFLNVIPQVVILRIF